MCFLALKASHENRGTFYFQVLNQLHRRVERAVFKVINHEGAADPLVWSQQQLHKPADTIHVIGLNLSQVPGPRSKCGVEMEKQESLVNETNPTVKMVILSAYNLPTSGKLLFLFLHIPNNHLNNKSSPWTQCLNASVCFPIRIINFFFSKHRLNLCCQVNSAPTLVTDSFLFRVF